MIDRREIHRERRDGKPYLAALGMTGNRCSRIGVGKEQKNTSPAADGGRYNSLAIWGAEFWSTPHQHNRAEMGSSMLDPYGR
jgi:hypothetical protein